MSFGCLLRLFFKSLVTQSYTKKGHVLERLDNNDLNKRLFSRRFNLRLRLSISHHPVSVGGSISKVYWIDERSLLCQPIALKIHSIAIM